MPGSVVSGIPGQELKEVLAPGKGTTEAARALGGARRRAGLFPYQWLYPGPNSRHVCAEGVAEIEGDNSYSVLTYRVPEGLCFSLRAVMFLNNNPTYQAGDGNISFSLGVTGVGPRPVEFMRDMITPRGSFSEPWPITGRLEFQSKDILEVVATVTTIGDDGGFLFARLIGHVYPNAERGEG